MAMPLTTYFNWETSFQPTMNDPEMMMMSSGYCSSFQEEETPPPPLDYSDHETFFFPNNSNSIYPNTSLLDDCYYSFPELSYPIHPPQYHQTPSLLLSDYDTNQTFQYPCPNKRKRLSFEDNYQLPYLNDTYFCDGGFEDNYYSPYYCSPLMPEFNDIGGVVPPLQLPAAPASHEVKEGVVAPGARTTVSAQSVAARERRKKIAEKTQELGRMVPGGSKMNTAEMLLAASKYVKYLQAQVSMLELKNTLVEDKASSSSDNEDEQLQAMLSSASVEEKLYLQEKCLVPEHLVTTLTNQTDIQSKPSILKDLNQLIIDTDADQKKQLQ